MGIRANLVLAVAALATPATAAPVRGTVEAVAARWSGDAIVTEAEVRGAGGEVTRVIQLGGVVDDIGMVFTHQPAILQRGDEVALELAAGRTALGASIAVVLDARTTRAGAAPTGGAAAYGVQRTLRSDVPLRHTSGCILLTYDASTVAPPEQAVIEQALATWADAAAPCGGLAGGGLRAPVVAAKHDGRSTVHVRRDRWCRPATMTEPELCYAAEASAVTRLVFVDAPGGAHDGEILEADLELNAVDFVLLAPGAAPPPTTKPTLDLLSIATHEVGHILGLAHNCGTGREAWPRDHAGAEVPSCDDAPPGSGIAVATMFFAIGPGETGARDLAPGDTAGACAQLRGLTCDLIGGCSAGGAQPGALAWLLALAAVLHRRPAQPSRGAGSSPAIRRRQY